MGLAAVSSVVPTPGGAAGAFHTATAASLMFIKNDVRTEDAAAVAIVDAPGLFRAGNLFRFILFFPRRY